MVWWLLGHFFISCVLLVSLCLKPALRSYHFLWPIGWRPNQSFNVIVIYHFFLQEGVRQLGRVNKAQWGAGVWKQPPWTELNPPRQLSSDLDIWPQHVLQPARSRPPATTPQTGWPESLLGPAQSSPGCRHLSRERCWLGNTSYERRQ